MKTILFHIIYFACLAAIVKIAEFTPLQVMLTLSLVCVVTVLFALHEIKK